MLYPHLIPSSDLLIFLSSDQNPVFMPPPISERIQLDVPLFNLAHPPQPPSLPLVEVVAEETTTDSPPTKKPRLGKVVTFAV